MIASFPAALQAAIQQNFLEREFQEGLESTTVYRSVADLEIFPANVGETVTKTRKGLKAPKTTPLNPSTNTNLDNGLTPSGWTIEQYTLGCDMYGDTIDLNMVTQGVGIESQFLHNARTNGVQGAQSVDRVARGALLNAYMTGHTRVTATLGGPAATIAVDDIRGFTHVPFNGKMEPVANDANHRMEVFVNGVSHLLIGATPDGANVSTVAAIGGISGTLTFTTNVLVANGTQNNPVVGFYAPTVLRPNGRSTTKKLVGTDLLTMGICLDAVTQLRNNAVPSIGGRYNCYLDNTSARQLFADPDFKQLFQGSNAADEFANARVMELLDLRFLPTTEAVQQVLANEAATNVNVHRPLVCGQGTLVEGVYSDTAYSELPTLPGHLISIIAGICMATRAPLDRLAQIIAQSWYYIGGFVCPSDVTATQTIIPTASNAIFKRAVMIEHA